MTAPAFGAAKRTPEDAIPRDGWNRPLIIPPDGGKPVAYTRASTFKSLLEDKEGLIDWTAATALIGASRNETIVRGVRPLTWADNKAKLRELVKQAKSLGGGDDAANEGTTLHALTELVDTGQALPDNLDATTRADLDAYRRITDGLEPTYVEKFVVVDEYRVAGTLDRGVRVHSTVLPEWIRGRNCVVDLKTGGVEYAIASFTLQLSLYANGKQYDPATGARTETDLDKTVGLLLHLPQRTGTATLYALNLTAGWEACRLAAEVKAWRSRARLSNSRFTSDVVTQIATA